MTRAQAEEQARGFLDSCVGVTVYNADAIPALAALLLATQAACLEEAAIDMFSRNMQAGIVASRESTDHIRWLREQAAQRRQG